MSTQVWFDGILRTEPHSHRRGTKLGARACVRFPSLLIAVSSGMLSALLKDISSEFPSFRLVPKQSSSFMKLLNILLRVLSLGMLRGFMSDYITTIGYTVYLNTGWYDYSEVDKVIILRHERVHMRQRAKYGSFLFSALYLLLPLPLGFAYFRAKFEMEAYEETIVARTELLPYTKVLLGSPNDKENFMRYFTGPDYLWMWPFRVTISRWYFSAVKKAKGQPNVVS